MFYFTRNHGLKLYSVFRLLLHYRLLYVNWGMFENDRKLCIVLFFPRTGLLKLTATLLFLRKTFISI